MNPAQWNASYTTGIPHWDPGRPQPAMAELVSSGAVRGRVLDAGCGSGEHVLLCAAHGLDATGVDIAPTAIGIAQGKAAARGLTARFIVHDVHRLADLGETFDTVLDSGLLHILTNPERDAYLRSIRAVLAPGGRMYVLCFSDRQQAPGGPRRLSRDEVVAAFTDGWHIDAITPTTLATAGDGDGVAGWLVSLTLQSRPVTAHARVPTVRAQRYLEQFCRHAEQVHRIGPIPNHPGAGRRQVTVRRDGPVAILDFTGARCTLDARADALLLRIDADDTETLHRIQALLSADLGRFARRDQPAVTWEPGGSGQP
ncbi:DUF2218 domain-containing protein [Dactylosporangium sp. McL0621]|uniref:DUF2218 domain-containing protein n=1 Tax=Dactylosporangium sp. McL0621 TaxID=3415678 RepID=UPI003CF02D76